MAAMPSPGDLNNHDRTPSALDDLAYGKNRERITKAIDNAVRKTMHEDGAPQTDHEYRFRARKAWAIAQAMRYELSWNIFKITDKLYEVLRMDLNGENPDPQGEKNDKSWWAKGLL